MLNNLIYVCFAIMLLLLIITRRRFLAKTRDWVPILGVVTKKSSRNNGETYDQLVDVKYVIDECVVQARDVETDGMRTTDYPIGSHVHLLVDPRNHKSCVLEAAVRPEFGVGWIWQAKKPWK